MPPALLGYYFAKCFSLVCYLRMWNNKTWNPCRRSCEPMYISKIKSKCGIAQLSLHFLSYFPAAAYIQLVELINLDDLLDDTTFLLSTNQSSWFCLGRSVSRSAGRPEIAMYGGNSHDLKIAYALKRLALLSPCLFLACLNIWNNTLRLLLAGVGI